ncbi:MAG: hypothetical protein A2Y40_01615 [Candidatus Margulisbacteria bacterium GWF2_35_9]|nr:MAG: hypothetical protein A2Y40_01615 [Candidatus Margulisbacteria bacterium GWF2_35_9]
MKVIIDNKEIEFTNDDQNIVELAARAKILIPAPCYREDKNKGCCEACLVEINGKPAFACSTKPEEGMKIIVNRPDLNQLRLAKMKHYESAQFNLSATCGGDCSCSEDGCSEKSCSDSGCCC